MRRRGRRLVVLVFTVAFAVAPAAPALAYLKFGIQINGRFVSLKWSHAPVPYFVTERGVPGVGPSEFQAAVGRAFATWQAVPTTSIAYQFVGYTAALPGEDDGMSTLGFLERPDLDRVVASTSFLIDSSTGELLESDIFFNAALSWSTAPGGEPGKFDVQSIAQHEIGHFSGLSHSALGETVLLPSGGRRLIAAEAVMFPIAFAAGNIADRMLRADDIAGISDLYPNGSFNQKTGSVSGRITKNGNGLVGAHVVAFDPATGSLVGNFSLNAEGAFSIAGLSPGPHIIRIEPLDDPDVESFFSSSSGVDLDFRVAFFDRLVIVPRGGDSGAFEVKVVPK
jgi:hypothetical protein